MKRRSHVGLLLGLWIATLAVAITEFVIIVNHWGEKAAPADAAAADAGGPSLRDELEILGYESLEEDITRKDIEWAGWQRESRFWIRDTDDAAFVIRLAEDSFGEGKLRFKAVALLSKRSTHETESAFKDDIAAITGQRSILDIVQKLAAPISAGDEYRLDGGVANDGQFVDYEYRPSPKPARMEFVIDVDNYREALNVHGLE
ncbi:MAG: hypothetical protein Fues2KO_51910 [Fuerstiella sp.]